MVKTIKHASTATGPESGLPNVLDPSEWNQAHTIENDVIQPNHVDETGSYTMVSLTLTGDLTVSGTVDGRDISADLNQAVKTTSSPTFADVTLTPETVPATVEGKIYYDSAANKLKFWNGSAWETITSAP